MLVSLYHTHISPSPHSFHSFTPPPSPSLSFPLTVPPSVLPHFPPSLPPSLPPLPPSLPPSFPFFLPLLPSLSLPPSLPPFPPSLSLLLSLLPPSPRTTVPYKTSLLSWAWTSSQRMTNLQWPVQGRSSGSSHSPSRWQRSSQGRRGSLCR